MKKSRYTDEQIAFALRQAETGLQRDNDQSYIIPLPVDQGWAGCFAYENQ